ncbi:MAG: hypothetical protein RDV41_06995, partial [Planctomycetota bacterium]|nr:hypothetical protein [Planctomycetota bacterium]
MKPDIGTRIAVWAVIVALLSAPSTAFAEDKPGARELIPSKAELQKAGIYSNWVLPWEMKPTENSGMRYMPYDSEQAFFAKNELTQTVRRKDMVIGQVTAIPDSAFDEMRTQLAENIKKLDEAGAVMQCMIPSPIERISQEVMDQLRQGKLTKATLVELYTKYLTPLRDATELPYVCVLPLKEGEPSNAA